MQHHVHKNTLHRDESRVHIAVGTQVVVDKMEFHAYTYTYYTLISCLILLQISIRLVSTLAIVRKWLVQGRKDSLNLSPPLHPFKTVTGRQLSSSQVQKQPGRPSKHPRSDASLSTGLDIWLAFDEVFNLQHHLCDVYPAHSKQLDVFLH